MHSAHEHAPVQSAGRVLRVHRVERDGWRIQGGEQKPDCQHSQTETSACVGDNKQGEKTRTCLLKYIFTDVRDKNVVLQCFPNSVGGGGTTMKCGCKPMTHLKDCQGSASCGPLALQATPPPR